MNLGIVAVCFAWQLAAAIPPGGMTLIPPGFFQPPFAKDTTLRQLTVPSFWLDKHPVTQAEFQAFVSRHPEWKNDSFQPLLRDSNYLRNWPDGKPRPGQQNRPVTYVSWHAAKAYCAEQNKRLPATMEWERVAATRAPGMDSAEMDRRILDWFARPTSLGIDSVGSGLAHAYGVTDLHGLIWEWTSDYKSWGYATFNTSRAEDSAQFCGGGGNKGNSSDYILFMRYGFRSSLQPHFAVAALGFRCAKDP